MMSLFTIREYGVISEGALGKPYSDDGIELDKTPFQSITNFIEENSENKDFDNAFSIFKKSGRRHIRVRNYVGVIETKQGVAIEILPKIFKNSETSSIEDAKLLFLRMLKTLSNTPFINLRVAHLKEVDKFPILEIFVNAYLTELKILFGRQLRGDYNQFEENSTFIKGKLLISENIKKNSYNKTKFFCSYDIFSENIPPNRLIKSTLRHLFNVSKNSSNKRQILKFLNLFEGVHFSRSIDEDLNFCKSRKRMLKNYVNLISWSETYLKNKSFTNFHGGSINQAILFPMEKLFENYIAYLISKYCDSHLVNVQDKKYALINQKLNSSDKKYEVEQFPLRPDIVINTDLIIIDTKWKVLDQDAKKFGMLESDIYQMHAYGRRYQSGNTKGIAPRLGLIYPKVPTFLNDLMQMRYGDDLYLDVLPFDLASEFPDIEIQKVINKLDMHK